MTTTATRGAAAYHYMPAAEAAADPNTPEDFLFSAGCRDLATLRALLGRRPMSVRMKGWLVRLVSRPYQTHSALTADANTCVTQAARLPHLTAADLHDLAAAVQSLADGHVEAAMALMNHPEADDELALHLLAYCGRAVGRGLRLDLDLAAQGSLAPTAMRLVHLENHPQTTPWHSLESSKTVLSELHAALGDDISLHLTVARLGPTWSLTRDDLLDAARAITS